MATIGQLLKSRAELSPDLEAIVWEQERITYHQYNQKVNRLANYLLAHQIKYGDRVALISKNTYAFPLVYLAAMKVGAIIVPVNTRLKLDETRWIINDCKPKALFYDVEFSELLNRIPDGVDLRLSVLIENNGKINDRFIQILESGSADEPNVMVKNQDLATMIYTSGTTGNPRGVLSTHANVYAAALTNINTLDLRYADRFLFVTPLFHVSGMMFIINSLVRGMTLILGTFSPVHLWELVEKERITGMMSVPSMLGFMLQTCKTTEYTLSSLRGIICGGSTVPAEIIREFNEFGFSIIQVYGATEFTGAAAYFLADMDLSKSKSVGKVLYLNEVRIVDPLTGETLPPGEIGEVVIRGDQVFTGYWNNPEETEKVLKNGWYYTKDVGYLDSEGYLYIIDRLRDMIICSGEKIFPAQVESVIAEIEGVQEVAVVGIKDPIWGELPKAYVVKSSDAELSKEFVLKYTRSKIADFNIQDVEFIEELPKNSMGKVLKYVLREYGNSKE